MNISTPCVGVCRLGARGICVGCGRTIEQIATWGDISETERQRIMAKLAASVAPSADADDPQRGPYTEPG